MKRLALVLRAAIAATLLCPLNPSIAAEIFGAGATFPQPIYLKWAEIYKMETGRELNYRPIGSAGGIEAISARTVTFGASDVPLSATELKERGNLVQWPMLIGGIVPIVNLDGITVNDVTLDGETLAKIFLGEIKTWDDAALKRLNPALNLSSSAIVVVHRSDGSGTTFNFTAYLSKVSDAWKAKIGAKASVEWITGIGAKGNQGVADTVQKTKGAIGYAEAAFAKQNRLATAKMINRSGRAVEVSGASVHAAAANWWWMGIDWSAGNGVALNLTDQPGAAAWPICASTFILMPAEAHGPEAAKEVLKFFAWAYRYGDEAASKLDYVPMPVSVKELVMQSWTGIKGPHGQPVLGKEQ